MPAHTKNEVILFMLWLEASPVASYSHKRSSDAEGARLAVKAAIKLAGYLAA